ncbi:MAG: TetR/AcrR family transcriptional regulator [Spirochaetes bacterium]|nr:TetR/AcrR family transcriptional regulator [Spirochaetota bacterium]
MASLGPTALRTKSAIMESALRLWKERGFDSVTVDDITGAAGVAKGSFYTYFSTKSDIIVEEFKKIDAYYADFARRRLGRYATARAKLSAFTRAQMRYVRDEIGCDSLKVLYANQTSQPGGDKILTNGDRHWVRIVEAIIAEGQASGEFRADLGAERLAGFFNRSARAVFLDWCIGDASFDLVKEGVFFMERWAAASLSPPGAEEGRSFQGGAGE